VAFYKFYKTSGRSIASYYDCYLLFTFIEMSFPRISQGTKYKKIQYKHGV